MSGKKRGYALDVDAWVQFHLLRLATFHDDTTKADLAVLAEIIQRYYGKYGNGWATHEHLGAVAGISKASVIRAKRNLERLGFITVVQAGRRGSATVYRPSFDLVHQKGVTDDTQTKGSIDDAESMSLGITDDTISALLGITDDTPSYLPDRPTRAESQIDRVEPAPASPPPPAGLVATGAESAGDVEKGFNELWLAYGYRQKKADAKAAYRKLAPDAEQHEHMVASADAWRETWAAQCKPDAPRFTLAKWIEREEYECDPPSAYKAKERKEKPPAKKPEPANDNIEDAGQMVCDVGPFTPLGRFTAEITGSKVVVAEPNTESVVLDLSWSGRGYGPDAQHKFYFQHPDQRVQDRGQGFIKTLADILDIEEITNTDQLHGRRVECAINDRYAIRYERAA